MSARPTISVSRTPIGNGWIPTVAISLALLCSAVSAVFKEQPALDQLLQACGLALPVFAAFVLKVPVFKVRAFQESSVTYSLAILFLLSATLSSILASITSGTPYSLIFTTVLIFTFLIYGGIWNFDETYLWRALKAYAMFSTAAYLTAWILLREPGERFSALIHPNYWGTLCFTNFCLSGLFESFVFRIAIQLANLLIILASESRSSLLATIFVALILSYFSLRSIKNKKNIPLFVLGCIFACGLTATIFSERISDLVTDAFRLDDPYRGSQSGFTGRDEMWSEGLKMFETNPFFGVGARMEGEYMASGNPNAHSGYISTLAQYGAIGSFLFFSLAVLSGRKLWVMARLNRPGANTGIAFIVGYAITAIFEPKLLSVGNPVSLLLVLFLFCPKHVNILARTDKPPLPRFKPYYDFAKVQTVDHADIPVLASPRLDARRTVRLRR